VNLTLLELQQYGLTLLKDVPQYNLRKPPTQEEMVPSLTHQLMRTHLPMLLPPTPTVLDILVLVLMLCSYHRMMEPNRTNDLRLLLYQRIQNLS
jgi:hypothetical protein